MHEYNPNRIGIFTVKSKLMILFPAAKINLGLNIVRKRHDGFHDIETIFYPVGLCDVLEYVIEGNDATADSLTVTGIETGSDNQNNIIIKILSRLRKECHIPPLRLHLHKAIPVGAGLGGGSADAACLMKVLNRHLDLGLKEDVIRSIALETGSDCPFFIDCTPSFATGRGEILSPLPDRLKGLYLVLLNPGVGINTGEAYRNCIPHEPLRHLNELYDLPLKSWKECISNDFEEYAFNVHPVIKEIKESLYRNGAIFSLMSGSGSSVYGLFDKKPVLPADIACYSIWEGQL